MIVKKQDSDWLVSVSVFVTPEVGREEREEEGSVLRTVKGLGRRSLPGEGWKGRRGPSANPVAPPAPIASRDLGVMTPPPLSNPVTYLRSHMS